MHKSFSVKSLFYKIFKNYLLKKKKSIALKLLSGYLNTKNEQFNRESGEHGL